MNGTFFLRFAPALLAAAVLIALMPGPPRAQTIPPIRVVLAGDSTVTDAQVYAGLGDRDAAFARLETAFQERSANLVSITADQLLAPLHGDARFERFVRRMNLPWP